jgi:dienelactone hydrolase
MLQRVSFVVPGGELEGTLHLPETSAIGGAAVLHGFGGDPEQAHIVETCEALAAVGVAALRFAYRDHEPPRMTLASGLADAGGAVRLLKAHPDVPSRMGVVGFSFGGAVAALVAGRDSRIRAAVLAAAPATFGDDTHFKPIAELSRTRARVLLVWGTRDREVPFENAERYSAVLSQARVTHRVVRIEGGDHDFDPAGPRAKMAEAVAAWIRECLAS